jgi:hypothetical protein
MRPIARNAGALLTRAMLIRIFVNDSEFAGAAYQTSNMFSFDRGSASFAKFDDPLRVCFAQIKPRLEALMDARKSVSQSVNSPG